MQKLTLEDLEYQLDPNVSADANLQHLLHVFEGYASASDDNPYPRDSARWWSWFTGYGLRSPGDHGEDVDENDIEDRIPARDGFGRK